MHPVWMEWLKKEHLFFVDTWTLITFHNLSWGRRVRTRRYWDALDECEKFVTWTDNTSIAACSRHEIACRSCLVRRHVVKMLGENMDCPQSANPDSREACFNGVSTFGGLCQDCFDRVEFGCGYGGDHKCEGCVYDAHHSQMLTTQCTQCGHCEDAACEWADRFHCRVTCPSLSVWGQHCG